MKHVYTITIKDEAYGYISEENFGNAVFSTEGLAQDYIDTNDTIQFLLSKETEDGTCLYRASISEVRLIDE